jgi:AraC-like DNA-binding protein
VQELDGESIGDDRVLYAEGGLTLVQACFAPRTIIPAHEHKNFAVVAALDGEVEEQGSMLSAWTCAYDPAPGNQPMRVGNRGLLVLVVDCQPEWLEENGLGRMPVNHAFLDSSPEVRFSLMQLRAATLRSRDCGSAAIDLLAALVERDKDEADANAMVNAIRSEIVGSDEIPSVAELAQTISVHPTYLARVFRRETGCTITQFIQRVRLARAASLVTEKPKSLFDVALDAGFYDHAHFTKQFVRTFGLPPSRFIAHNSVASVQSQISHGTVH